MMQLHLTTSYDVEILTDFPPRQLGKRPLGRRHIT